MMYGAATASDSEEASHAKMFHNDAMDTSAGAAPGDFMTAIAKRVLTHLCKIYKQVSAPSKLAASAATINRFLLSIRQKCRDELRMHLYR